MLLRSITLRQDLALPERLSHYRPTSRSLPVVKAVMGVDATMAVAAYGSGKSLAAGVGALIVRNDPYAMKALRPVVERMGSIDAELHRQVVDRQDRSARGRVVVLAGHERDLIGALRREQETAPESPPPPQSGRHLSLSVMPTLSFHPF